MSNENEYHVPNAGEFTFEDREEILNGYMPTRAEDGPWRPVQEGDNPHPDHIKIAEIGGRHPLIPVRLYGSYGPEVLSQIDIPTSVIGTELQVDVDSNISQ